MNAFSVPDFPAQGENRTRCLDGLPGSLPVTPPSPLRRNTFGLGGHHHTLISRLGGAP